MLTCYEEESRHIGGLIRVLSALQFTWLRARGLRSVDCKFRFVHFSVAPAHAIRWSVPCFTCTRHADYTANTEMHRCYC